MSQSIHVCAHCGREGEEGEAYRFCLGCGHEHAAAPPSEPEFSCGECGNAHDGRHPFCGACGAPLVQPEASAEAQIAPEPQVAEQESKSEPERAPTPPPTVAPAAAPEPVAEPISEVRRTLLPDASTASAAVTSGTPLTTLTFLLAEGFRFLPSQPAFGSDFRAAGADPHVNAVLERLRYSEGGALLVTGHRGIGKTSTVAEALQRLKSLEPGVLTVSLSVSRPIAPLELVYEVVRRLFEALHDDGVLNRLDAEVVRKLVLTYAHASMSIANDGARSHAADLDLAARWIAKLGITSGAALSIAEETALEAGFLQHARGDVEHDLRRMVELLTTSQPSARGGWFGRRADRPARYRLVVVLDDLDILRASDAGPQAFDALLSGLQGVLSLRGVHFVLVGGIELHHAYVREVVRGGSQFERVFASQHYLPCNLLSAEQLLSSIGATEEKLGPREYQLLRYSLKYASRGITRRLVQEFNGLVRFADGTAPRIEVSTTDMRKLALYQQLEQRLEPFLVRERTAILGSQPHDDARLQASHSLLDWLLTRHGKRFTVDEAVEFHSAEGEEHARLSFAEIGKLFEHLVQVEVIGELEKSAGDRTQRGAEASAQARVYQLSPWLQEQLFIVGGAIAPASGSATPHGAAQGAGFAQPTAPRSYRSRDLDVGAVLAERYELRQLVGQGGMGGVFRAWDRLQARDVAIKYLLDVTLTLDARRRFIREAEILSRLHSPHVVRCHEVLTDDAGTPLIVLDYVEGITLEQQLNDSGRWSVHEAVRLGVALASALEAIDKLGVCRIDLKPGNVMLVGEPVRPVLVDFGIARADETSPSVTRSGVFVGTPLYMSPEQAQGVRDIDIRSDIWALGMVLSEVLLGRHPLEEARDQSLYEILRTVIEADIELDASHAPQALQRVLLRALRRDREERYASPTEFRQALEQLLPVAPGAPATMSGKLEMLDPRVSHVALSAAGERQLDDVGES